MLVDKYTVSSETLKHAVLDSGLHFLHSLCAQAETAEHINTYAAHRQVIPGQLLAIPSRNPNALLKGIPSSHKCTLVLAGLVLANRPVALPLIPCETHRNAPCCKTVLITAVWLDQAIRPEHQKTQYKHKPPPSTK